MSSLHCSSAMCPTFTSLMPRIGSKTRFNFISLTRLDRITTAWRGGMSTLEVLREVKKSNMVVVFLSATFSQIQGLLQIQRVAGGEAYERQCHSFKMARPCIT